MSDSVKWILSAVVVPVLIGGGSAVIASQTRLATLAERVENVKEMAIGAKATAEKAHDRINFFHGGG